MAMSCWSSSTGNWGHETATIDVFISRIQGFIEPFARIFIIYADIILKCLSLSFYWVTMDGCSYINCG